ncbi:MAG: ABC transporter permease [Clostridia bacterium]|nr:ABC transporter permease [Clostridia bacterium]MBR7083509.1 ABC transporter permease [Clostridia bacterium]
MRKKTFFEGFAAVPHVVWVVLCIVLPLVFVVYFAFTDSSGAFSFENIGNLSRYGHIFLLSICFALISTALCLLIGYPLAYFMSRLKPRTQKILVIVLMLPMWISLLIRTYSLMAILDNGGLFNTLLESLGITRIHIVGTPGAVILGMVYDFLPYMVLPIYTSLSKLDARYYEAANDLGAGNFKTLFKVAFPLSLPGVISGITMVFVPSISTFYISQKLGGGLFDLIGDTIEREFQNKSTYNIGAAISLVMMILILISVAIMNRFSEGDENEGGIIV